jgi:hypothetical protein
METAQPTNGPTNSTSTIDGELYGPMMKVVSDTGRARYGTIRKCNGCGIEYFARRDSIKSGKGLYCSRECSSKDRQMYTQTKPFIIVDLMNDKFINFDGERYFIFTQAQRNYPTRRYGIVKECEYCGSLLFSINNDVLYCSTKCAAKNRFENNTLSDKDAKIYLPDRIRKLSNYVEWRMAVYERDNYTCQMCGDNTGGNLNAHHIVHFADIIMRNNITELNQAYSCDELWDITNGITLCDVCHRRVHYDN